MTADWIARAIASGTATAYFAHQGAVEHDVVSWTISALCLVYAVICVFESVREEYVRRSQR